MSPVTAEEFADWQESERSGAWNATAGDDLGRCTFEKAGFRAFRLSAEDGGWEILLSRLDAGEREPKGLLTVNAPEHDAAFDDLGGYVLSRSVSIFGGRSLAEVSKALVARLGESDEDWTRRIDYLCARAMREVQGREDGRLAIDGRPTRPSPVGYVFAGRVRQGRTVSLFGPGSSGKTTIAAGLAVSLSSNTVIVPGWWPTRAYRVGVLDWDEGSDEELVRLYAISSAYDVSVEGYRYARLSRPLADCADEVGRWVVREGLEVLVVSPVNRALRPSSGDPGGPVFELYEVLREFETTNILIDHVVGAQVDKKNAAREYGSVAKRDSARGSYSIFEQSSMPGSRVVVLRNTKPDALAPRQPPQAIRIDFSPTFPPDDGVYESIRFSEDEVVEGDDPPPAAKQETQPEKLARILREHGPMTATEICAITRFHSSNLRNIARKAREKGYHVHHDPAIDRYVLDLPDEEQAAA